MKFQPQPCGPSMSCKKYEVIVPITGPNGRTVEVLTVWQFDRLSDSTQYADAPRLVTLYVP